MDEKQLMGLAMIAEGCKLLRWKAAISGLDETIRAMLIGEPEILEKAERELGLNKGAKRATKNSGKGNPMRTKAKATTRKTTTSKKKATKKAKK